MCQLTEPIPGWTVALWPPNFAWALCGVLLIAMIFVINRVLHSQLPQVKHMKARTALGLVIASYVSIAFAGGYLILVAAPWSAAQHAWEAREAAILPPDCYSTTIDPAFNAASNAGGLPFVLFGLAPIMLSGVLITIAAGGRENALRWLCPPKRR